jgi:hypothetical protein
MFKRIWDSAYNMLGKHMHLFKGDRHLFEGDR